MPVNSRAESSGSVAADISNAVVKLLYQYTGRGPTKARTDISSHSVVVLMADTLTRGERVLVEAGQDELVLRTRRQFQKLMRDDMVAAVEEMTHARVTAFMSENHIEPDLAAEIFILEPTGDGAGSQGEDAVRRSASLAPATAALLP